MNRKSVSIFSVAALSVAALSCGSAVAGNYDGSSVHITLPRVEGVHYTAWFRLYSNGQVDFVGSQPADTKSEPGGFRWLTQPSPSQPGNWDDAEHAWSQRFWVDFAWPGFLCSASAQPGSPDYVAASVVENNSSNILVLERWTSTPNRYYNDPVEIQCVGPGAP